MLNNKQFKLLLENITPNKYLNSNPEPEKEATLDDMTDTYDKYKDLPFKPFTDKRIDDSDKFVAYRVGMSNRRQLIWVVYYKGLHIGHISKRDSRFVHDNWKAYANITHPFISRESRKIVDQELNNMRLKVMKAYRLRDSDIVY